MIQEHYNRMLNNSLHPPLTQVIIQLENGLKVARNHYGEIITVKKTYKLLYEELNWFFGRSSGVVSLMRLGKQLRDRSNNMEFQGFRNRYTWLIVGWIINDEDLYNSVREIILGYKDITGQVKDRYKLSLVAKIEPLITEGTHTDIGMSNDLISLALNEVDWLQVIDSVLDNMN